MTDDDQRKYDSVPENVTNLGDETAKNTEKNANMSSINTSKMLKNDSRV